MKALVTGGTGFIGSQVVQALLSCGHAVRLLSRRPEMPESLKEKNIEIVQGDLEDPGSVVDAMDSIELFYHIGEIKNLTKAQADKNITLIEKIIDNLDAKGVKRFVFVSSITVAGIPSEQPAGEETTSQVTFNDHYTAYKRSCEGIIRKKTEGCEYAIVRPAPVYGPGSRYLGRMVSVIETLGPIGLPFIGDAKNITPFVQVKDLAEAIVLAGTRPEAAGQIFNLTDGLSHTWLDFFTAIADALHKKVRIIPIPALLLKLPAIPLELFSGFFNVNFDPIKYIDYLSNDLLFDNAKAKSLLNWQPAYSLSEGVKEMVEDYKKV
ncbi:MAG: NAD(P)-dependent oxidoreductase [Nitrospirae bacterium]|nr:NAD(P)-dependent oxidoreductase [Nitrospirota bacterium]